MPFYPNEFPKQRIINGSSYEADTPTFQIAKKISKILRGEDLLEEDRQFFWNMPYLKATNGGWSRKIGTSIDEEFDSSKNEKEKEKSNSFSTKFTANKVSKRVPIPNPEIDDFAWKAFQKLGMEKNRILLQDAGPGYFIGLTPEDARGKAKITALSSNPLEGLIANALYRDIEGVDARIQSENEKPLREFYDAAFTYFSVPMYGNNTALLETYEEDGESLPVFGRELFSLEKALIPGGILIVSTDEEFLNSNQISNTLVRKKLFEKMALVGAYLVPVRDSEEDKEFKATSLMVLIKRTGKNVEVESEIKDFTKAEVVDISKTWKSREQEASRLMAGKTHWRSMEVSMNEGYLSNDRIKGTLVSKHGRADLRLLSEKGIAGELTSILDDLSEGLALRSRAIDTRPLYQIGRKEKDLTEKWLSVPDGSYVMDASGQIAVRENGADVPVQGRMSKKTEEKIVELIGIRDTVAKLKYAEESGMPEVEIEETRRDLNERYDSFFLKFGAISRKSNYDSMDMDPRISLLMSIEKILSKENELYEKGTIFKERTLFPKAGTNAISVRNALLFFAGRDIPIHIPSIEAATNKKWNEIMEESGDLIVEDISGNYQVKQNYLSGNVKEKLRDAESAARIDLGFARNVEMLKAVQPEEIAPSDISFGLDSNWLPVDVVKHFVSSIVTDNPSIKADTLGSAIAVHYSSMSGWNITSSDKIKRQYDANLKAKYGTDRISALSLIESAMNGRTPTLSIQVGLDPKTQKPIYTHDHAGTEEARTKMDILKDKFVSWVFDVPERLIKVADTYNEKNNVYVPINHSMDLLEISGVSPEFAYRDYQKEAVSKYLQTGNLLLNLPVGSGKTAIIAASIMESIERGISKKAAVVVPSHLVTQVGTEIQQIFPAANILVVGPESFRNPNNRERIASTIKNSEWDAVILGSSTFQMFEVNKQFKIDRLKRYEESLMSEIDAIEKQAKSANKGAEKEVFKKAVTDILAERRSLLKKIDSVSKEVPKNDLPRFEEFGFNLLVIDESHVQLKNMPSLGNRNTFGGSQRISKRADEMAVKIHQIREMRSGRHGVILASGSALTNRVHKEAYDIISLLNPQILKQANIHSMSAFMGVFATVKTSLEASQDGQTVKLVPRITEINNIPEFRQLLESVAFSRTQEELNIELPEVKRVKVVTPPGPFEKAYMDYIADRAERRNTSPLVLTTESFKLCVDSRFLSQLRSPGEDSALSSLVRNVLDERENLDHMRGTQILFLDIGVPGTSTGVNLYQDIKDRLIEKGMPEEEIAFIHDADDDDDLDEMMEKMRSGDIRLLMLPSSKSTGLNIHERMGALHHFSIPWNPDEIEQREGRIRRYGNQNKEVRIYTYLTTNIAQFRLQTLERKSQLIKQAFGKRDRGTGGAIRHVENEVDMDYMELLAATTGNPDIKENAEVSKTLMKLKMLEKSYNDSKIKAISKVGFLESELEYELSSYKSKSEFMEKNPYDKTKFSMELKTENGFEIFEDRSKAAIHLVHALSNGAKHEIIGKYKGRDICVSFFNGRPVLIDWNKEEGPGIFDGIKFEGWQAEQGSKIIGWMDRLIGMKEAWVEKQEIKIKEDEESIASYKAIIEKDFEHTDLIQELAARQKELMVRIEKFKADRTASATRSQSLNMVVPFGLMGSLCNTIKELGIPDSVNIGFNSGPEIRVMLTAKFNNGEHLFRAISDGKIVDPYLSDLRVDNRTMVSIDGKSFLDAVKAMQSNGTRDDSRVLLSDLSDNGEFTLSDGKNMVNIDAVLRSRLDMELIEKAGILPEESAFKEGVFLFEGSSDSAWNPLAALSRASKFMGDEFSPENAQHVAISLTPENGGKISMSANTGMVFIESSEEILSSSGKLPEMACEFSIPSIIAKAICENINGKYALGMTNDNGLIVDRILPLYRTRLETIVSNMVEMPNVFPIIESEKTHSVSFDIDLDLCHALNDKSQSFFVNTNGTVWIAENEDINAGVPAEGVIYTGAPLQTSVSVEFTRNTISRVISALQNSEEGSVTLQFNQYNDHFFPLIKVGDETIVAMPAKIVEHQLPQRLILPEDLLVAAVDAQEMVEEIFEYQGEVQPAKIEEIVRVEAEEMRIELAEQKVIDEPVEAEEEKQTVLSAEIETKKTVVSMDKPEEKNIEFKLPTWLSAYKKPERKRSIR